MAKKKDESVNKKDEAAKSQADLEAKFKVDDSPKAPDKKPVIFQPKKNFDMEAYKKLRNSATEYKTESFIPMGQAFQNLTLFPGFPQGHVHMVYGNSDVGKTTMLLELAKYAQSINVMPIFIITERKWSWTRAETMGINREFCLFNDDLDFIEEACDYINQILKDQADGKIPFDIVFLWDSVGATPSRAEWEAYEEHQKAIKKAMDEGTDTSKLKSASGGMMITARVLRDQIERKIQHKITKTRNANFPYFATLFIVNHGYISPNPMGPSTLVPYGGGGIKLACSFVFRQGNVSGNPTKVHVERKGIKHTYGLEVPLILEKNHINGISREGKVVVTPGGYIESNPAAKEAYVKEHSKNWEDSFDKYFEAPPDNDNDNPEPDMDIEVED